jgi:hypothetical protein
MQAPALDLNQGYSPGPTAAEAMEQNYRAFQIGREMAAQAAAEKAARAVQRQAAAERRDEEKSTVLDPAICLSLLSDERLMSDPVEAAKIRTSCAPRRVP